MGDIADVAERMRLVRSARRKFLRLWEIDRSMIDPMVDRLAAEIGVIESEQGFDAGPAGAARPHPEAPPADIG